MIKIRPNEVSKIIRQRISKYRQKAKVVNVGTVLQVGDGIARIYGLDKVMAGELVEFSEGTVGIALNLESDNVGAVLMGDGLNLQVRRFIFILTKLTLNTLLLIIIIS